MDRFIEKTGEKTYDLIVVGGGITGAAVAYDAAMRGLSVALLEKNDFGGATSAATSKLIHGGFRYIANFELGIVRESLRERRILSDIAPNLVTPIPVLVPCYTRGITRYTWVIRLGMMLYDALSFDKGQTWDPAQRIGTHRTLPIREIVASEPAMPRAGLKKIFTYHDCASLFPERLTFAFVRSAVKHGAEAANHAKVEEFLFAPGEKRMITGVRVRDMLSGRSVDVKGRLTVNCAGPWADLLLGEAMGTSTSHRIRRSEGIHIITRKPIVNRMIAVITSNGRGVVMTPWRGHTLIGPTDKEYTGNPDEFAVTPEAVHELINSVNDVLEGVARIEPSDVVHTYGGLRPLVGDTGKSVRDASRKYEIRDNALDGIEGLITVEGGKYTTSRNLARNTLETVAKKLGRRLPECVTHTQYLAGCDIKSMDRYLADLRRDYSDFSSRTLATIARYYGTEAPAVLEMARGDSTLAKPLNPDGEIGAQVAYSVRNEMARTLEDVLFRRTGLGTLGDPGAEALEAVASIAAKELGWDAAAKEAEVGKARARFTLPL